MDEIERLLTALTLDPGDDSAWLALADAHEDQDEVEIAEITRLSLRLRRELDNPEHPNWECRLRVLVNQGVRVCLPRRVVQLPQGANLSLVLIPPGKFWMGSPPDEEGRFEDEHRHPVEITKGFWLAVTPVTQEQYRAVIGNNPSHFEGENLPVENVSRTDCQDCCTGLNQLTGWMFRLPTEAEWEYACRAGTTTAYNLGPDEGDLARAGWYVDNSDGQTHPVGQMQPNAWGFFDMHGNVWEWCQDWYKDDYYPQSPQVDPTGPSGGSYWVSRSGSWLHFGQECRSAVRTWHGPADRRDDLSFRVALSASECK
jgi:formylglycine-generating enzyme required for sulfatase activity